MFCSFIIGFHTQRMDNLLQTIRFLEKLHPDVVRESELVLVCQDSSQEIANSFAKYSHHNLNLPCMHLPYVTNYGVDHSESDKLIILESDRVLPPGYFRQTIDQLQPGIMISTENMVRPQEPITDEQIESAISKAQNLMGNMFLLNQLGFKAKHEHRTKENRIGMRNMWSGNTAVMRSDFEKAGKMDESYKGYGWADSDMTHTLNHIGVESVFRTEVEMHLWHPGATYATIDDSQMFVRNGLYFCRKWKEPLPDWLIQEKTKLNRLMI